MRTPLFPASSLGSSVAPRRTPPGRFLSQLTLGLALTGLVACSSESGGSGGSGGTQSRAAATAIFGVVKDSAGAPIAGATVRVGGASARSDDAGKFQMAASAGPAVVRVEAAGFAHASERVEVHGGHASAVDVRLLRETPPVDLDASAGGTVEGPRGATLEAPPGAFVDPSGNVVSGVVKVSLTPLDPGDPAQLAAAPGDFSARSAGGSVVMLESFGMMDIVVRQGDTALNIAPGKAVKVRIPAPATGPTPETMPLWSFDLATSQWVEEGTVTLDPATRTYQAELPHLSFWNADLPLEATCITGLVKDTSGAPLPGAKVTGRGVDYTGSSDATAGLDGRFYLALRRSSGVDVLAMHKEGGGQERRVTSGDQGTAVPPTPGDPRCLDVGEWSVEKGVVTLVGKGPVSCSGYVNPFASCQPAVMPLFECFKPEGTCKQKNLFDVEYENGAALRTDIDTSTSAVTQTYLGPGGQPCGTSTTKAGASSGEGTSAVIVYKLPGGAEVSVPVTSYGEGERIEMTCQDGSRLDLQGDELRQWEACSGGGAGECEGPAGLPTGSPCTADSECREDALCCDIPGNGGFCVSADLCIGQDACQNDSECTEPGTICCIDPQYGGGSFGGNRCLTEAACYSNGKCKDDSGCEAGERCCGGSCTLTESCDGACSVDADCGGAQVCCGQSPEKYCTDATSCYGGQSCTADSECGGGLLCCGDEGNQVCQAEVDCFKGKACESDAQCGSSGALGCCESPLVPGMKVCDTESGCLLGKPCAADGDCPLGGFVCCLQESGAICVEGALCYSGKPCEQPSDCPAAGLTCCDLAASGKFCLDEGSCPN